MKIRPHQDLNESTVLSADQDLWMILDHLTQTMERDTLVCQTTDDLRAALQVDRVVLYHFYRQWRGQVRFESLRDERYSIFGSRGADDCFNDEYAVMYLEGRVRAIPDVELEAIQPCHLEFLRSIQVRANLVVPVLTNGRLWGLLIAHHCQGPRSWSTADMDLMGQAAQTLATAPSIAPALRGN